MSNTRKTIPLNVVRQLWAQCGGYCQSPSCNKMLFRVLDEVSVSLANVAHVVGHGDKGPRTDHELAHFIDRDGIDNLIMLCIECHKVVDELERRYPVEMMMQWKQQHSARIDALFSVPQIRDEHTLLMEVNDLLDANAVIFKDYGPYSNNVLLGESGDGLLIWKRRSLDTLVPNNRKIVQLIEQNKRNFKYPWDVYPEMLAYKMHADAFQDNCLTDRKVNDYKLFPLEFDHFIKSRLGISTPPVEVRRGEELEYRRSQVHTLITRFLVDHNEIAALEELNRGTMLVNTVDGRELKVFVTNTYCFTEYSLDKVLIVDPAVDAIICSSPAGGYSLSVKQACIERNIGLFMLGEFMGALRMKGEDYLNYLLKSEREERLKFLKRIALSCNPNRQVQIYAFGSFLRRKVFHDVDIFIVYPTTTSIASVRTIEAALQKEMLHQKHTPDITVGSSVEFAQVRFQHANLTEIR